MTIEGHDLTTLEEPSFTALTGLLKEKKIDDFATSLVASVQNFIHCEVLHRKSERAKTLDLPKVEYYEDMATLHNTQGLRRLRLTRASLDRAIKGLPPEFKSNESNKEMLTFLDEHRVMFKNELFEQDLQPIETQEAWDGYTKARKAFDEKGVKGLLDHVGAEIDELIVARTDLDKGRRHQSPIYWKAVVLAAWAGVCILMAILCFIYSDCSIIISFIPTALKFTALLIMTAC